LVIERIEGAGDEAGRSEAGAGPALTLRSDARVPSPTPLRFAPTGAAVAELEAAPASRWRAVGWKG
jgi:hypothetical protein